MGTTRRGLDIVVIFHRAKTKEYRIKLSKIQKDGLLILLGEAEGRLDMKEVLPEHNLRSAAYKAIRKLRNAVPVKPKD